jgi:STE24 endopeptidase
MIQFNTLFIAFLVVFVIRSLIQLVLSRLNIDYLRRHGNEVPRVFLGLVDKEKLTRISAYTVDSSNFGMLVTLFGQAFLLVILLAGFLPWLSGIISRWQPYFIVQGLVFFAVLFVISNLLHIPFSLYSTFVIEDRHGFNTRSPGLWFADWIKSFVISAILGGILLLLLLAMLAYLGTTWWLWAWMVIGVFELIVLWAYPVVIAPLFNKFDPITDGALHHRIVSLMEVVGLRVRGVFQMDAGKRSKHTNAYFTGIGRTKRIVLFDTLLSSHPAEEILSILAHEIGHWKKRHTLKQLLVMEIFSLLGLYLVAKLLNWFLMYQTFGFEQGLAYVGLFLVGTLMSPLGYFVRPVGAALSRKFEREADDVAVDLMGETKSLCDALRRLALENLANLVPHPLYAWFYYSHPPSVDRIVRLQHVG